ncbi:conserved unknown protein [Ectocarpus siliculosus]|uniref:Uncharacterized protein n=1 Tax=Ectocarpus siliculosus TaxID=2880 RepID=D7FW18_ECTSI|nr:conserved unknown protein [Ectocarpus siliculosus]|eukprot:CBJ25538.1 conserved unknown protein [Ectocarpus siliculosus]
MITTGGDGGGDSSDAGGVIGSGGGGYERGGDNGDENNTVPDALEVFLEPYEAIVREFNSRAASNWARAASEGLKVSSGWGADVFDPSARGGNFATAPHKLDHDREQLEYLVAKGRLPPEFQRLAEEYGTVGDLVEASLSQARKGQLKELGQGLRALTYGLGTSDFGRLRGTYNSVIHVPKGPADGDLGGGYHPTGFRRALNPNLDWRAIEDEYLSQELPLLWFDGFLLPEALQGVLDFCREATVFFDIKPGYLGAYFNDGLTSPWLVQIAHELQERLPQVLEGMTLSNLWAYKFDSDTSMDGIATHSDHATVNLNFWVTPDDANLDPSSGGLVVYPKVPPSGEDPNQPSSGGTLDMKQWNNSSRVSDIESWLKDEGVYDLAVTVPYRQNRVVVFDSRLLHRSDKFLFREGYENRRINLTFLFSPVDEAWNEDYHRQSRQQQE